MPSSTLLDLIDDVNTIKQNIRTSIINKGVSVDSDTPFPEYSLKIDNISTAGFNPQNRNAIEPGTYTYQNGSVTYLSYNCNNYFNSNDTVYIESPLTLGRIVYDSKINPETNKKEPDFNKIIGSVTGINNLGTATINNIVDAMPGQESDKFVLNHDYDSLNSVTVNVYDIMSIGPGSQTTYNSNVLYIRPHAFVENRTIREVTLNNVKFIGAQAFEQSQVEQVYIPAYEGYTLNENGSIIWIGNSNLGFAYCDHLTHFSAPNLKILPNQFICQNNDNFVTLDLSSLIGLESSNSLGYSWAEVGSGNTPYEFMKNHDIDFTTFQYMGSQFGGILEQYIADTDNNITDTLTFNNLRGIGNEFTSIEGPVQRNLLDNITKLIVPNLQFIGGWANVNLNITSIDLPEIKQINDSAFNTSTLNTINIGSKISYISNTAFNHLDGVTINIDLPEPSETGEEIWKYMAPWGASNATVNWVGSNE